MMARLWKIYISTSLCCLFSAALAFGQKEPVKSTFWKEQVAFKGYLKFMETSAFANGDDFLTQSLIHNRLNFNIYSRGNWSYKIDFRNRIIWGSYLKAVPGYMEGLTADNGLLDLSFNWAEAESFVFNTTIDRLWVDYSTSKFAIRAGRQRINWGINYVWNPNDLFNAFNYFDFDYEERPGADALRMQYFTGGMSAVDVSLKPAKEARDAVYAAQYRFNYGVYDFQVLGGYFQERVTLGGGLAGNLGTAALKAEATWFGESDSVASSFSGAIDVHYGLKNGINLIGSYLYNSKGLNELAADGSGLFLNDGLSPDNLMPSKHSLFADLNYAFNPLLNGDLGFIYAFGMDMLFIMPNVTFSIKENLDLNVIGQFFVMVDPDPSFLPSTNFIFIRFKWSF
jgi:hypothetical protein